MKPKQFWKIGNHRIFSLQQFYLDSKINKTSSTQNRGEYNFFEPEIMLEDYWDFLSKNARLN